MVSPKATTKEIMEYVKNSYNSISKTQITQFLNGQEIRIDIVQRRYTKGQKAHENIDITGHQRHANQNHIH